jgi:hypothetical protein
LVDWIRARCQIGCGKGCVEPACKGCVEPSCKGCVEPQYKGYQGNSDWMPSYETPMEPMQDVPAPEEIEAPSMPEQSAGFRLFPGRLQLLPASFGL